MEISISNLPKNGQSKTFFTVFRTIFSGTSEFFPGQISILNFKFQKKNSKNLLKIFSNLIDFFWVSKAKVKKAFGAGTGSSSNGNTVNH